MKDCITMDRENDMGFSRKWKVLKEKLLEKFDVLTNEDLLYIVGRDKAMMNRIQQKLGKTELEMDEIINDLEKGIQD